jgi:4-hydroxythreonine-4-phosphate dehydrogenase
MSANAEERNKIKIGISIGDVNGIGPEVVIKTLANNELINEFTPIIYASSKIISYYKKALNLNEFNWHGIAAAEEAKPKRVNVVNVWNDEVIINIGVSNETGGSFAFRSLEAATKDLASGKIDVLVTAPINKQNIQSKNFNFPGHTEYLANLSNTDTALMTMVSGNLRIATLTGHVPLKDVAKNITRELIQKCLNTLNNSLKRDFNIVRPKIAVLGLNPHAGDNGLLGDEEIQTIKPAIEKANKDGIFTMGPYGADGFFASGNYKQFDAILGMYHDQVLTPFKTLAFETGVNYTAGLPIVRTSPDHGTGYDIAGKNIANESSFREALYLAKDIFFNRKYYKEITANPLQKQRADD